MKLLLFFIIVYTSLFSSIISACTIDGKEGFAPPNNLRIPVGVKAFNEITEKGLKSTLHDLEKMFSPMIDNLGNKLVVVSNWESEEVNAYASRPAKTEFHIEVLGGLGRFPGMTYDDIKLIFCHELGHHVGGSPLVTNHWASTEGESDYWGSMKCLREVFKKMSSPEDHVRYLKSRQVPDLVQMRCDATYEDSNERNICYRISLTGKSTATLLNTMSGLHNELDFSTPNPTIVEKTDEKHPEAQCRLDTYFQGIICPKDISHNVSEFDSTTGVCSLEEGDKLGTKPLCWFKPRKIKDPRVPENVDYQKGKEVIQTLVREFYLQSIDGPSEEHVNSFEFPILNYVGNINFSKEDFIKDTDTYYARWEKRSGELVSVVINDARSNKFNYEVKLVYNYNFITKTGKNLSGTSENILKYKYVDGKYLIYSIVEVVRRDGDANRNDSSKPPSASTAFYNTLALLSTYFDDVIFSDLDRIKNYYNFPIAKYFGDKKISIDDFLLQSKAYFQKWHTRNGWIENLVVDEKRSTNKKIYAQLDYRYDFISKVGKVYRGNSSNKLIFEWVNGEYLITSIEEKVKKVEY